LKVCCTNGLGVELASEEKVGREAERGGTWIDRGGEMKKEKV